MKSKVGIIVMMTSLILLNAPIWAQNDFVGRTNSESKIDDQIPAQTDTKNLSGKRFEYAELHMGVQVRLVVFAPDEETAKRACRAAFERVAQIEQVASDYRPTSELMKLCAHFDVPNAAPVKVSDDLWTLLEFSQRVAQLSDGAFDISVGPLVSLWRTARRTKVLSSRAQLNLARSKIGWRNIELNAQNRTVRLRVPGMRLDLGGVAKGYAGDCALKVLWSHGIGRALFEAGGDIVASGAPPGEIGWKVLLPEGITTFIAHGALSTSGDTSQWVEIGGRRYSHVIDPRTGLGLSSRWMATVWASSGMISDALSTAATLLGPQRAGHLSKHFERTRIWTRRAPELTLQTQVR